MAELHIDCLMNEVIILIIQCRCPELFPPLSSRLYRTQLPEEIGGQDAEYFMRQERLDKTLHVLETEILPIATEKIHPM
ncbi:hypothetical protein PBY51_006033 [Eleginops maclovinus]|uniref:Uncharacterized protein n=1 Tax=Eleginops maclovinus TaxID=56733 RepID=A0AAN7WR05_ELEMC|nr:hypothetical protein PBY51_006033 [Eleginops maclovinus]